MLCKRLFFYRIAEDEVTEVPLSLCYLSDSDEEGLVYVAMPTDVGESVISDDETFGMMVGGKYAYCGLLAEIIGVVERRENELVFSKVESLLLKKNNLSQNFQFRDKLY